MKTLNKLNKEISINHMNKNGNKEKLVHNNNEFLKFHPDSFNKYLIDTYGYKIIKEELLPSNSKTMIQRKIYIFQKSVS